MIVIGDERRKDRRQPLRCVVGIRLAIVVDSIGKRQVNGSASFGRDSDDKRMTTRIVADHLPPVSDGEHAVSRFCRIKKQIIPILAPIPMPDLDRTIRTRGAERDVASRKIDIRSKHKVRGITDIAAYDDGTPERRLCLVDLLQVV